MVIMGDSGKFVVGRVFEVVDEHLIRVSAGSELIDVRLNNSLQSSYVLDAVRSGREVFLKVRLSNGVEGQVVEVLNVGEKPFSYPALDPSKPDLFARHFYMWVRVPRYLKVIKFQHLLVKSLRDILDSEGFTELLPPVLSVVSDPGLRGARKVTALVYNTPYELSSSTIMYKQVIASVLGKMFFVARNVREEPPDNVRTGRHLIEFTQLDLEWAGASMYDVMRLGEKLVYESCEDVVSETRDIVDEFNPGLKCPRPPYERITFSEAVERVRRHGFNIGEREELPQEAEEWLSVEIGRPFWLVKFPSVSRGFYYMPDEVEAGRNRDFNLILPNGFGELIDGGEREYRYEFIVRRLKELKEDTSKYSWFLNAVRAGIAPSAGFGLGVERYTRYLLRLKYIWEATPFPKPPGVVEVP